MVLSKILSKILNSIFPFADFLYILQLEEYFSLNYLKTTLRFWFRRNIQKRDQLRWTSRIQTTFAVAVAVDVFVTIFMGIIVSTLLIPLWIFIANLLLTPFYNLIKSRIVDRASKFMRIHSQAKVIGIAGSFGKTTTKNLVYEFIRLNYKTQMVPGNLNTPVGIANWLLVHFDKSTEYLIVEMDAFTPGAIRNICKITPPDIAILTNVGDQHLSRFKSQAELKKASYEIFDYAKPGAFFIKQQNVTISHNYRQFSESVNYCIAAAKQVAQLLKVPNDFIEDSIKKFELPDRRQKLTQLHSYQVVDDSYNISLTTAKAGIDAVVKFAKEKKVVVITAGIPEAKDSTAANKELGNYLSDQVDFVVILNSIFAKDIASQLGKKHYLAANLQEAWTYIKESFEPQKTIILLQPELTDLYY